MLTKLGGTRHITMPIFFSKLVYPKQRYCIFRFSKWQPSFFKSLIFLANELQRIKTNEHVKFWQNQSIGCKGIEIFQFFKMAGATILDFQINCEISLADSVWKAQTHHRVNVVKIGGLVVEKLQFFEFTKLPPTPSCIFETAKFYWLLGWRGSRRISMPNLVKIGQSVAKILRFSDFSIWRPPPSWIVEFTKVYWLSVAGGPRRITLPNFVKIGRSIA